MRLALRSVETLKRVVIFFPRREVGPNAIGKHSLEVAKCLLGGKNTLSWSPDRPRRHDQAVDVVQMGVGNEKASGGAGRRAV
jgi:hypothetical protein